jgi:L-ascorbate metabolism protein UlaG (beta-lactamase superfamily)
MHRYCTTALVALLFVSAVKAADPVTIRWHGQSFFEVISSKGTRIVLDPHAIEAYGRKSVKADLVLMTHTHNDHTMTSVVENLKSAKQINAIKEDREMGRVVQEWNLVNEQFKDVHIQTMGTYHDNSTGMQRGKNGVWIIDVDGLRIVHLGDLGHQLNDAQIEKLGKVDILMIPIGGVYTINGLTAAKVVNQIKPRRMVLPMHYGTDVYMDLLDATYFLGEQKREHIKRATTNEVRIDPAAPVPEAPVIQMLKWSDGK